MDETFLNVNQCFFSTGTDEKAIIKVLTSRTNSQRQEIEHYYKTAYGKDLVTDLKKELSGDFEDLVMVLMEPYSQYDARFLRKAMEQLAAIKDAYKKEEREGTHGKRDESYVVDLNRAKADAQVLYEAGENTFGTDESEFQRILVTRNWMQMRAIFDAYQEVETKHSLFEIAGRSIEDSIKREMSGDLEKTFLTIVKYCRNPAKYFAEVLHKAMAGLGTDEDRLTRTIITRSEIDLGDIKRAYEDKYDKSLASAVESEVGGDVKRLLLGLIK
ncbi:Annexin A13 [Holothuria leucospilota]|uniref:Annexin n=1 Tax=Holothuria leucospilota TaxID=206669 RepID=A0A9Q1BVR9_HOLLE|nr:Annexin A13 [Holothuria leucospilota]